MRQGGRGWTCAVWFACAAGATGCLSAQAAGNPEAMLRAATVTIGGGRCAGVIVGNEATLLTSAHCIQEGEGALDVAFEDGARSEAELTMLDRARDVAILHLAEPADVLPLEVAHEAPTPGEPLWFAGRNDYGHEMQGASLLKLGRCPSLPEVPAALFTTIRGIPGDSGSPIVDGEMRVVGLVHGGAACSIAAPVHEFAAVVGDPSTSG